MPRKTGIVNVRMVITEEKILSNIDKVQKIINPNSKKQIIQLEDDTYFKDLIESIKTYLIEYPKKKNFPVSVYKAAYELVEYATSQFEENTKKIEELIRQREENIGLAEKLREAINAVEKRDKNWKEVVEKTAEIFSKDMIETLTLVGKDKSRKSQNYQDALKLLNARVNNLETNLHIEIDMERIEDRSKALSFIGIEIADALKEIPRPAGMDIQEEAEEIEQYVEEVPQKAIKSKMQATENKKEIGTKATTVKKQAVSNQIVEQIQTEEVKQKANKKIEQEIQAYEETITVNKKPTLWEKIKNSKLVRAITYVCKIKIKIELPNALPEGRGE